MNAAQVYHHTVGQNAVLELDFAIDRNGQVDPAHATRYKEFGDWIRSCYGKPVASTSGNATQTLLLKMPTGSASIDRVWVREDQVRPRLVADLQLLLCLPMCIANSPG